MMWMTENLFPDELCLAYRPSETQLITARYYKAFLKYWKPHCFFSLLFFPSLYPRTTQEEAGEGRRHDGEAGGSGVGAVPGADAGAGAAAGSPRLPPALRLLRSHWGPLHLPLLGHCAGEDLQTRGKNQFWVCMAVHSKQFQHSCCRILECFTYVWQIGISVCTY